MGVLTNTTVIDLSRVYAGPFGAQFLADLGATVWKVEALEGDDIRRWGDHAFNAFNRGKRSIAVNLKDPRGQEIVRRLASTADVMVENFKVGDLARYGLDYASLGPLNPGLVYVSLTGFGQSGPLSANLGYDTIMQAMTGIMSVTGEPDGPPTRVGIAWIDLMAGLTTALAVLAALLERKTSELGQYVDLSLYDVGLMSLIEAGQSFLQSGVAPSRRGNITRNISPAQIFETTDGWIALAIGNDQQFRRLCHALARPDLKNDPRFLSNELRVANRAALSSLLASEFGNASRASWRQLFDSAGIPSGPVMDIAEAISEPQATERKAIWQLEGRDGQPLRVLANPLRHMSRTPARGDLPPPRLGEHTEEMLSEILQIETSEIKDLVAKNIVRLSLPDVQSAS